MRSLLAILILFFSIHSSAKANDLTDLKIDNLSIGDSVLDLFTQDLIEKNKATYYKDKTYSSISFDSLTKEYDEIQVSWKTSDKQYKIVDVTGGVYQNDMKKCYDKMDEVKNEIIEFIDIIPEKKISHPNPFGLYTYINFFFDSGDQITISCYDYDEKYQDFIDIFRIALETKNYRKWMNTNPYE